MKSAMQVGVGGLMRMRHRYLFLQRESIIIIIVIIIIIIFKILQCTPNFCLYFYMICHNVLRFSKYYNELSPHHSVIFILLLLLLLLLSYYFPQIKWFNHLFEKYYYYYYFNVRPISIRFSFACVTHFFLTCRKGNIFLHSGI